MNRQTLGSKLAHIGRQTFNLSLQTGTVKLICYLLCKLRWWCWVYQLCCLLTYCSSGSNKINLKLNLILSSRADGKLFLNLTVWRARHGPIWSSWACINQMFRRQNWHKVGTVRNIRPHPDNITNILTFWLECSGIRLAIVLDFDEIIYRIKSFNLKIWYQRSWFSKGYPVIFKSFLLQVCQCHANFLLTKSSVKLKLLI